MTSYSSSALVHHTTVLHLMAGRSHEKNARFSTAVKKAAREGLGMRVLAEGLGMRLLAEGLGLGQRRGRA